VKSGQIQCDCVFFETSYTSRFKKDESTLKKEKEEKGDNKNNKMGVNIEKRKYYT